jgi:hypothetical protein
MSSLRINALLVLATLACTLAAGSLASQAGAAEWRLQQIEPPPLVGEEGCTPTEAKPCRTPVGLGRIGDIEFAAANRGLLITAGNGSTVKPGVWDYNGASWHELASECGATDGRIAWSAPATTGPASGATPQEFWTVSNGRPGQAANPNGVLPPVEDNTLCHFAVNPGTGELEIVTSYASLGFEANSYQPMDAAACLSATDCWFAGGPLPAPQLGAFHLHWNGSSVEPEPNTRVEDAQSLSTFEGKLYEGVGLLEEIEGEQPQEILHPPVLQEISAEESADVFEPQHPEREGNPEYLLPEYASGSRPRALSPLQLSSAEGSLWAAAGPVEVPPAGSSLGELIVLHDAGGIWSQVLGPAETGPENHPRPSGSIKADPPSLQDEVVNSIAAEPGTSSAWLALDTQLDAASERPSPTELATVVHVEADGELTEQQLPSEAERKEGVGPKGAAYRITCPAQNDCWLATTQGWLFHLSEGAPLPVDSDAAFNGPPITFRPKDEGVPQQQGDAPPLDDSGLEESPPGSSGSTLTKAVAANQFATVTLPLLSNVHTRLIHGTTLELSFHLAVKARIRLIAKRHSRVVASTATRTLTAGRRSLQLHLNIHRWPTKLELQTHALASLPTASTRGTGVETVSTSLAFPQALGLTGWGPSL